MIFEVEDIVEWRIPKRLSCGRWRKVEKGEGGQPVGDRHKEHPSPDMRHMSSVGACGQL
jgi:hypothetical protein